MAQTNQRIWRRHRAAAAFTVAAIITAGAVGLWLWSRHCGWDGSLGQPGFDDPVAAVSSFHALGEPRPRLWVGGYFSQAHDVSSVGAATWDGKRWAAPVAFNGPVRAMRALDEGASNGKASLIIAGQFTQVRGLPMNYGSFVIHPP